jgi:purine-nucleoside phosphorylase
MKQPASPLIAAKTLLKLSPLRPALAIILGTGFECPVECLCSAVTVPYGQIPGYPEVGVSGHAGTVTIGRLAGEPVLMLSGRAHFYEGYTMSEVTFAVRSLAAYGIRNVLLTNAAGGICSKFRRGDFMIIRDHINLMGVNPLRGQCAVDLSRFVDLSLLYNPGLRRLLRKAGKEIGLVLREGIYLAVSGPSYETPAEIKAFRRLGADAVGMSTVPEAIVAHQCGMKVAALSCITNPAAGLKRGPLSHTEVLQTAAGVRKMSGQLLIQFVGLLSKKD